MPDFEQEVKESLAINDNDMETELKEQATKQYYYGAMWVRAVKAERAQKLVVESLEAELSKEFRLAMSQDAPKERVTEKMIKEYITGHPKYKEAMEKMIRFGMIADMFNVARGAFESRGRMLLEMSKRNAENKFYDQEYRRMREEYERQQEEGSRKRKAKKEKANKIIDVEADPLITESPDFERR